MTNEGAKVYKDLIINVLYSLGYSKLQKIYLWCEVMHLFLTIKGKVNFSQLERYGVSCEKRYRSFFEQKFDFMEFNSTLTKQFASDNLVVAIDPSYVSKSGKHTAGLGYFWSGCAGKNKWGIELVGFAAVDLDNHTALHLDAAQTLLNREGTKKTLMEAYCEMVKNKAEKLKTISKDLVADAWFSKKPFVDQVINAGMHMVSRFRDDVHLQYLYDGPKREGRGRPRTYDGKVEADNLNMKYFKLINRTQQCSIYSAVVHAKALDRQVLVVCVKYTRNGGEEVTKLYFSTDLTLDPIVLLDMYSARFQIEFIYRDAKQYTGLENCQARSENKLNFHFNMSLTAVNIAKVKHWFALNKEDRRAFSMDDIKTLNNNRLMLDAFLCEFGINPNTKKNKEKVRKLQLYGVKAA